jgi:hypothetical protein
MDIITDTLPTGTFTLQDTPSFARRDNDVGQGRLERSEKRHLHPLVIL